VLASFKAHGSSISKAIPCRDTRLQLSLEMIKTGEKPPEDFCLSCSFPPDILCDAHPQSFNGFPLKGASADRCRSPSSAFPSSEIPQILSQGNTGRKSAHFRAGQILNPYPHHYSTAFAFSDILYHAPPSAHLAARFPQRERYGLTMFRTSTNKQVRFRLYAGGATSATEEL